MQRLPNEIIARESGLHAELLPEKDDLLPENGPRVAHRGAGGSREEKPEVVERQIEELGRVEAA
jgi:hypothetical protein